MNGLSLSQSLVAILVDAYATRPCSQAKEEAACSRSIAWHYSNGSSSCFAPTKKCEEKRIGVLPHSPIGITLPSLRVYTVFPTAWTYGHVWSRGLSRVELAIEMRNSHYEMQFPE